VRSQNWHDAEQRRLENLKRNYRDGLAEQLNEKQFKNAQDH